MKKFIILVLFFFHPPLFFSQEEIPQKKETLDVCNAFEDSLKAILYESEKYYVANRMMKARSTIMRFYSFQNEEDSIVYQLQLTFQINNDFKDRRGLQFSERDTIKLIFKNEEEIHLTNIPDCSWKNYFGGYRNIGVNIPHQTNRSTTIGDRTNSYIYYNVAIPINSAFMNRLKKDELQRIFLESESLKLKIKMNIRSRQINKMVSDFQYAK